MNMGMGMGNGAPGKKQKTGGGAVCSTHGKERGEQNMVDDGMGGMCCRPDSECQTGGGGGGKGGGTGTADGEQAECSTHGKKRSSDNLTDDGAGGYCCIPGRECNGADGEQAECSTHGKKR